MVAAASQGLGYAIAETLAAEGAHVAIAARKQDTIDAAGNKTLLCHLIGQLDSALAIGATTGTEAIYGGQYAALVVALGRRQHDSRVARVGHQRDVILAAHLPHQ